MYIATGISEVVTIQATKEELGSSPEKIKVLQERISKEKPSVIGADVIGGLGVKISFIGEPEFREKGDTLIQCKIHVKVTVDDYLRNIVGFTTQERDFYAWTKCKDTDKEKYDFNFGCRVCLNKVKIKAYSYYQRMFVRIVQKTFKNIVTLVGYNDKLQSIIFDNAKYIHNICEKLYPPEYTIDSSLEENNNIETLLSQS